MIAGYFITLLLVVWLLQRHTNQLYAHAKRIQTLELEMALVARGYFLRDDRPIREGGGFEGREEAYSLFQKSPYERVHVYGGPKAWAVRQAYAEVFGKDAA